MGCGSRSTGEFSSVSACPGGSLHSGVGASSARVCLRRPLEFQGKRVRDVAGWHLAGWFGEALATALNALVSRRTPASLTFGWSSPRRSAARITDGPARRSPYGRPQAGLEVEFQVAPRGGQRRRAERVDGAPFGLQLGAPSLSVGLQPVRVQGTRTGGCRVRPQRLQRRDPRGPARSRAWPQGGPPRRTVSERSALGELRGDTHGPL